MTPSRPSAWNRIELIQGDITKIACDAVVNAANTSLLGGGGVDGAIHRAAGPELLAECKTLGGCATGRVRMTRGYRLPAKFVIHAVGPVYRDGTRGEPDLLRSCYAEALALCKEHGIRSIAFPAISCGIYGYPLADAARIALGTTHEFLMKLPLPDRAVFALFEQAAVDAYRSVLRDLMAISDSIGR